MLLTLSALASSDLNFRTPHDFSPPLPSSTKRFSPKLNGDSFRSLPASASMTMSQSHRGLPPPAAMALPDPSRPPPPISQPLGQMPAPPSQWQGAEESMRNWLMAKAEEDRRKQEEEKTRQESLRLEQRKIEQAMLRESMQGGVPPHLVPMIFAGMGGANLANVSLEWVQQYAAQLQAAQQQQIAAQSQVSPELQRETRMISSAPPGVYGVPLPAQQSIVPAGSLIQSQPLTSQPQHTGPFSPYAPPNTSPSNRSRAATQPSGQATAPTSAPRPPPHSQLPRLTTNEMQIHPPPSAPSGGHPLQQSQTAQQDQSTSSPSIYFHHWVPPTSQGGSDRNPPATPSEYTSSPKKRKAQGSHQAAPAPSTTPHYTSPSFSHISSSSSTPGRRGHGRTRSDASTRGFEGPGRPMSRPGTGNPESGQHRGPEDRSDNGNGSNHNNNHAQANHHETRHSHYSAGPERGSVAGSPKRDPATNK